jgi:hypothetical protein
MNTEQYKRIKISENDEILIDLATSDRPTTFFRISSDVVLGKVPCQILDKSILYLYQRISDGTYKYAGILEVAPVETQLEITTAKRPFQILGMTNFINLGDSKTEDIEHRDLMFEESGFPKIHAHNCVKIIFAAE